MRKQWTALLLAALLVLTATACGAPAENDGRLKIIATSFPGYDLARAVTGDLADVQLLLPPGTESHSYEPAPRDILRVQDCDLFICLGGESEAWVETILASLESPVETLRMMDCVSLLEEEHDHDHEHGHGTGEVLEADEHVWTSPLNAAKITEAITAAVTELDGDNAAAFSANAAVQTAELTALDGEIRAFVATVDEPVMVFGDRFPLRYFAEEYGITCYSAFPGCSAQTEPSAATVAYLTDLVREKRLAAVYYIEFSNHLVADSIAEATGIETALFHSCHNVSKEEMDAGVTYLTLMRQNLQTLRGTMK